jgi:NAD(P)-dependent dehydrogenase (short-subunit alcohol dehydrogenase family)
MGEFAGKTALITGGARGGGIGYATARTLAEAGCSVIVTGKDADEAAGTPAHDAIRSVALEVRSDDAVGALLSGLDRLDILVNDAGMSNAGDRDADRFSATLDVNLTGALRVAGAARPLLAREGGAVVDIASIYALCGSPGGYGYAASKAGLASLTKSMAIDWAKDEIRVNAAAPGFVRTELTRFVWDDTSKIAMDRVPMARWGEPDEIADVIVFLCLHGACFMTGVLVPVDGGFGAV